MTMERTELQGEALAFYFIRGVFCFAGRGSRFLGSRCAYGYGAICVDWHCWHPAVRVCVSEVSTLSLFVPLNQSCNVCVCFFCVFCELMGAGDVYLAVG